MNIDLKNLFSDQQTLAFAQGAANSTNVIDLWGSAALPSGPVGTPIFDLGRGGDVDLLVQIVDALLSLGAATLQVQLVNADAANLTGNATILWDSGAIAKATLVAGYRFRINEIPVGCAQRYLGLIYTIATADGTAGKITAAIVHEVDTGGGALL